MNDSFAHGRGPSAPPRRRRRPARSRRRVGRPATRHHRRRIGACRLPRPGGRAGRRPGAGHSGGTRRRSQRRRPVPSNTKPQPPAWSAHPWHPRRCTNALAIAATLSFVSVTAAAAAPGRLPDDIQDMTAEVLSKLGITVPSSRRDHPPNDSAPSRSRRSAVTRADDGINDRRVSIRRRGHRTRRPGVGNHVPQLDGAVAGRDAQQCAGNHRTPGCCPGNSAGRTGRRHPRRDRASVPGTHHDPGPAAGGAALRTAARTESGERSTVYSTQPNTPTTRTGSAQSRARRTTAARPRATLLDPPRTTATGPRATLLDPPGPPPQAPGPPSSIPPDHPPRPADHVIPSAEVVVVVPRVAAGGCCVCAVLTPQGVVRCTTEG